MTCPSVPTIPIAGDSSKGFGAVLRKPGCAQNIRIVRPQADNPNQEDPR
jgi:hypothetical protein